VLPIFFVYILLLIKNATSDDDLNATLQPEMFPNDEMAKIPLSFHDYVTAMQVERLCEDQEWYDFFEDEVGQGLGITGMGWNSLNWMVVRRIEYPVIFTVFLLVLLSMLLTHASLCSLSLSHTHTYIPRTIACRQM
jgi:hypothetical protein